MLPDRPRRPAPEDGPGLRVRAAGGAAGAWHPLRRLDADGFELAAPAPGLRGAVEIWKGGRILRAALVVAPPPDGPARYEFKRVTVARAAPPADHVTALTGPAARANS